MTSIFCRVGKKNPIKDNIIQKIPDNFDLYVEPFVGSAIIYLNMNLENKKSVINDLDKDLIEGHKAIKKGITLNENNFTFSSDAKVQEDYYKKKHTNHNNKFIAEIIRTCGTFGGRGVGKIEPSKIISKTNFKNKIKNAKKQKEYYKNTQIFNTDYKNIIKKFDNSKTFFYLDPPYETSYKFDLYKDSVIDLEAMANLLKNIKGRFLLSINDSPNVRKIFKNFDITMLKVRGAAGYDKYIGQSRNELLIKNY
jgi:DNA adenine methylase